MNTCITPHISAHEKIETWLTTQEDKNLLRFLTCGSVDDGKSTLIGRILHDTSQIYEDQLSSLYKDSKRHGTQGKKLDLALLVDGLQAEQEQGITIDVAYRYFSTEKCKFIVADTPGHEQYTRNMVTGASTSDVAVLLIDVRKGILEQTRRHSFICTLLGIKYLVVVVNKMDLVEYKQKFFDQIKQDYLQFALQLPQNININFVPISALEGDNVIKTSSTMNWYDGKSLLHLLENIDIQTLNNHKSMRFPVQYVNRPNLNFRGYSGTIASGIIRVGQCVKVLPSGIKSVISRIVTFNGDLQEACSGETITVVLKDEIDISRGDILVDAKTNLKAVKSATVDVVWMTEQALKQGQKYEIKIAGRKTYGFLNKIIHQIDINTLKKIVTNNLPLNGIGLVEIIFEELMVLDSYSQNKITGGMIFIDLLTNITVGMGMINQPKDKISFRDSSYKDFELELNALVRRYFPYWNVRNISDDN